MGVENQSFLGRESPRAFRVCNSDRYLQIQAVSGDSNPSKHLVYALNWYDRVAMQAEARAVARRLPF